MGHGERVAGQDEAETCRSKQLHVGGLELQASESGKIDEKHGADKADGAPDADGREILHRIHPRFSQRIECYRVAQSDGGHEEGHRHCVEREEGSETDLGGHQTVNSGETHEEAGDEMADAEHALSRHPAVGDDADHRWHEERHYALHGVKPSDLFLQAVAGQEVAQRCEI